MGSIYWRRSRHVLLAAAAAAAAAAACLCLPVAMATCESGSNKPTCEVGATTVNQAADDAMISSLANASTLESLNACSIDGIKVCLTPGCVRAASMLLENADFEQDPCDDFYNFACGKFLKNTIIPDDDVMVNMITKTHKLLKEQMRIVVEELVASNEPKPYKLVKNLYEACMNTTRINEIGLTEILQLLKDFGGWPVLDGSAWNMSDYDWKDNIYKFRGLGISVDYIIKFTADQDLKNSTIRILDLDQADLGLDSEFLVQGLDNEIVQAYYKYMVDEAVLLGADKSEAEKELRESLLFEIELAKISLPPEERVNISKLYNPMTLPELQQQFPSIPWTEYITKLLAGTVKLKHDEVINVAVPSYISSLQTLLKTTSKRVLANYLQWRAFNINTLYLPENVRNIELEYLTVLAGVSQYQQRGSECADIISFRLEVADSSLYVTKFFNQDSKRSVTEIADAIRAEMTKILTEVDWMDEQTRQHALEKAKTMTEFIGYPEEILLIENLEEFYKKLEISSERYLKSIMNVRKFKLDSSFSQLRDPYNKSDWRLHADIINVNGMAKVSQNYIEISAGILQPPFFSNERPMYLNFAAIGCLIAHEVTHGFDIQGHQFDKAGNLIDWWDPETKKRYFKKAACFIEQYGNYTVEEIGLKVNGITTQGENTADTAGLKETNNAYKAWVSKHGEEPRLPGFVNYSTQQMFWIGAASIWCSKSRSEALVVQINTDEHAPDRFRVIGPFSNTKEFAKDFNCPLGSKMNPVEKCGVW